MKILWLAAVAAGLFACTADTFVGSDAGGDAAIQPGPLGCGSSTCQSFEACCVYDLSGASPQYECHATCPAPQGGAQLSVLACTSTADCPGGVCCIHRTNGQSVSACETQCNAANNEAQLCDPQATSSGCPSDLQCSTSSASDWGLPSTFGTCGGQGP
jgi:hypothetical protein